MHNFPKHIDVEFIKNFDVIVKRKVECYNNESVIESTSEAWKCVQPFGFLVYDVLV